MFHLNRITGSNFQPLVWLKWHKQEFNVGFPVHSILMAPVIQNELKKMVESSSKSFLVLFQPWPDWVQAQIISSIAFWIGFQFSDVCEYTCATE